MEGEALDRDVIAWALRQIGVSHHKFASLCPDFLIISPPKTGSTWLAASLRRHPALFIPDVKELKYFSSYFKWLDLNWYFDQFAPGASRIKGEASPSYALLPVERIRLIRQLMPDVKLIYLMREPIARAWSHAKHTYRYREANFAVVASPFEDITDEQWRENFVHEWPLASGDYLGQLRRWLSVFPRQQMYIGFFESIVKEPEAVLRDVFRFLGISQPADMSAFPIREKVLAGLAGELSSSLRVFLQQQFQVPTRELASFLSDEAGMRLPAEWEAALPSEDSVTREQHSSYASTPVPGQDQIHGSMNGRQAHLAPRLNGCSLARILEHELAGSASPIRVSHYSGYELVYYGQRFYAIGQDLGGVRIEEAGEQELQLFQESGRCFVAHSIAELRERVDQHIFQQTQAELRQAVAQLARLRGGLEHADGTLSRLEDTLHRMEGDIARLVPWYVRMGHRLRAWAQGWLRS